MRPQCCRHIVGDTDVFPFARVCNTKFVSETQKMFLIFARNMSLGGISASIGKPSFKHSKYFRIISSNQKLARALTSTPKAIARTNTSCWLATPGVRTAGSVTSRRSDIAINCHLFPRLILCPQQMFPGLHSTDTNHLFCLPTQETS